MFLKQEIRLYANNIILTSSYIIAKSAIFVILSVQSFVFSLVCYIFSALDMDCRVAGINLFYLGTLEGQPFITIYSVYDANICSNKPITFLKLC